MLKYLVILFLVGNELPLLSFAKNNIVEYVTDNYIYSRNLNSLKCEEHVNLLVEEYISKKMWAVQMVDASTKQPAGILMGNVVDVGYFQECLDVEHVVTTEDVIIGKHCMVEINFSSINLSIHEDNDRYSKFIEYMQFKSRNFVFNKPSDEIKELLLHFSFCIPQTCTVNEYLTKIETAFPFSEVTSGYSIHNSTCQTKEDFPEFNGRDWAVSIFFIIIILIMVVSTLYDLWIQENDKEPAHAILIAFSCYSNAKQLISVSKSKDQLHCLHGIRFVTMIIIIYAQRCSIFVRQPLVNGVDVIEWLDIWNSQLVTGISVAGDTFFLLSGLLLTYGFLNNRSKGQKFNVLKFYLHRYLRLTPCLAAVILFHVSLLKHLGSGPFWPDMRSLIEEPCMENWWLNLLYFQNFVNSNEMVKCIGPSWFLAIDMQLFVLSPLILILLAKWPKKTIIAISVLICASMATAFGIAWGYELSPLDLGLETYMKNYYYAPHARAATWLLGVILGYYIHQYKDKKFVMNAAINIFGWVASFIIMNTVVVGPHNMKFHNYNAFEAAIFIALHRFVWTIGVSWIIWGCLKGYGGITNWFLSLPAFQVLGRLTYCMYLIHSTVQYALLGNIRGAAYFSELHALHIIGGDLLYTIVASIILTLSFERPFLTIEKIVFKKDHTERTILTSTEDDKN